MSNQPLVRLKKLHPDAVVPSYAYPADAGMDILGIEDYTLQPGERHAFRTGIAMALPEGYVALVWDKSGQALKRGITTLGGVIDSHYRGEYLILLYNAGTEPQTFHRGEKLAQVLIQRVEHATIQVVEELDETHRGDKGFGSTGI